MTPARILSALFLAALPALVEDREFIRALETAQRARPAELSSTARIAPESEPGTALVVHGKAFAADGKTPLVGAIVFGYHTDREGRYDVLDAPAHSWRLRGWAKTGADGRFEFKSIRPAPYPGRRTAAHIHWTLFTADGARYHAGASEFDDDPLVGAAEREEQRRDPFFCTVRSVRREGAVEHVDVHLRAALERKF
jgi:protocatechuate 3,4-dioxygenase beta subunit